MKASLEASSTGVNSGTANINWADFRVVIENGDAYIRLYSQKISVSSGEAECLSLDLSYEEFIGVEKDFERSPFTFAGNTSFTHIREYIKSDPVLDAELLRLQVFRRDVGAKAIKNSALFLTPPYPIIYSEYRDGSVSIFSSQFNDNLAYTKRPVLRFNFLTSEWYLKLTPGSTPVFCIVKWNEPEQIVEVLELMNDAESLSAHLALLDPEVAQKFSESYNNRSNIMSQYQEALPYAFQVKDISPTVSPWYEATKRRSEVEYLRNDQLSRKTVDRTGEITIAVTLTMRFQRPLTSTDSKPDFAQDETIIKLREDLKSIGFATSLYLTNKKQTALIVIYKAGVFKNLDKKAMKAMAVSVPTSSKDWL